MIGLIDSMTVYSRTAVTEVFSTVVASAVPCRLALIRSGQSAEDRAALSAMRHLLWSAATVVAEDAQIEVNGERWSILTGTVQAARGPNGAVMFRRADVVRA